MKYLLIAVTLLLGSVCIAQQAKVIELSADDAAMLKQKWEALQKAQADWDAAQEMIRAKYLTVPYNDKEAGSMYLQNAFSGITGTYCAKVLFLNTQGQVSEGDTEECKKERAAGEEAAKKARYNRIGWENGFEFTSDFRFIVPKPALPPPQNPLWTNTGAYTTAN